jgi:hypothetical protein
LGDRLIPLILVSPRATAKDSPGEIAHSQCGGPRRNPCLTPLVMVWTALEWMVGLETRKNYCPQDQKLDSVLSRSRCCPPVQGLACDAFFPSITLRAHVTKPSDRAASDGCHPASEPPRCPRPGRNPGPLTPRKISGIGSAAPSPKPKLGVGGRESQWGGLLNFSQRAPQSQKRGAGIRWRMSWQSMRSRVDEVDHA